MLKSTRLGRAEVVNVVNLKWQRRPWIDLGADSAFARTLRRQDDASVGIYQELELSDGLFDMEFTATEEMALANVLFFLARLAMPDPLRVAVTLPLTFLDVVEDDVLEFDLSGADGTVAGGSLYGGPSATPNAYGDEEVYGGDTDTFDGMVPGTLFQVEARTLKSDLSLDLVLREL